jgi:hypothetical protein
MKRVLISSGSTFESEIGYSRAVAQGDWVFVSGTTGFDYATMTISEDIETQTDQCLRNIAAALEQAGASLNDVVKSPHSGRRSGRRQQCRPVTSTLAGRSPPASALTDQSDSGRRPMKPLATVCLAVILAFAAVCSCRGEPASPQRRMPLEHTLVGQS